MTHCNDAGLPYKYKNGTVAKTVFLGFYEPKDSWSADFVQKVNGMGIEVYENGVLTDAGAEFKIGRSGVIGTDGTKHYPTSISLPSEDPDGWCHAPRNGTWSTGAAISILSVR